MYLRGLERWIADLIQPVFDGLVQDGAVPRFVQVCRAAAQLQVCTAAGQLRLDAHGWGHACASVRGRVYVLFALFLCVCSACARFSWLAL